MGSCCIQGTVDGSPELNNVVVSIVLNIKTAHDRPSVIMVNEYQGFYEWWCPQNG